MRRMTNHSSQKSRINARIDQPAEEQLRYVTEHTQMNVTEALRASIALLYEKVSRETLRPADVLARGKSFVATGASGDTEGSSEYKAILSQSFSQKYQSN